MRRCVLLLIAASVPYAEAAAQVRPSRPRLLDFSNDVTSAGTSDIVGYCRKQMAAAIRDGKTTATCGGKWLDPASPSRKPGYFGVLDGSLALKGKLIGADSTTAVNAYFGLNAPGESYGAFGAGVGLVLGGDTTLSVREFIEGGGNLAAYWVRPLYFRLGLRGDSLVPKQTSRTDVLAHVSIAGHFESYEDVDTALADVPIGIQAGLVAERAIWQLGGKIKFTAGGDATVIVATRGFGKFLRREPGVGNVPTAFGAFRWGFAVEYGSIRLRVRNASSTVRGLGQATRFGFELGQ